MTDAIETTVDISFYVLVMAGWVAISSTTSGWGWSLVVVCGVFHLGCVYGRRSN